MVTITKELQALTMLRLYMEALKLQESTKQFN